jgi:hypothetical protein
VDCTASIFEGIPCSQFCLPGENPQKNCVSLCVYTFIIQKCLFIFYECTRQTVSLEQHLNLETHRVAVVQRATSELMVHVRCVLLEHTNQAVQVIAWIVPQIKSDRQTDSLV